MLHHIKRFLITFIKGLSIIAILLMLPIGYINYKSNIAEKNAHKLCDSLTIGSEITIKQLIKLTIDSESPPFFVSVINVESKASWLQDKGWSKKSFDFNTTSFHFAADWRGVYLDRWVCVVDVNEVKLHSKDIRFLD